MFGRSLAGSATYRVATSFVSLAAYADALGQAGRAGPSCVRVTWTLRKGRVLK